MQIPIFVIPLVVGLIIQSIKITIDYLNWEKLWIDKFFSAWWFPSVHSWLSTSLLTCIWYYYWIYSPLFAVTLIFSILFWYDAMNIRYQAWKHAQIINKMRNELSSIFSYSLSSSWIKLKERLWHTFPEVIWGIIISLLLSWGIIILAEKYWITFYF